MLPPSITHFIHLSGRRSSTRCHHWVLFQFEYHMVHGRLLVDETAGTTTAAEHRRAPRSVMEMGTHPANLAVRFLLELLPLFALGRWGWAQREERNRSRDHELF
jgi:hypothetical protein